MVTKGFKKKKSKRISSKTLRKVEKKVHEHNRKQKKEARKNPGKRKALKKDPGIPNSLPFKEDILAEIVEKKRKDFEQKKQRKIQKKANSKKRSLEGLVQDAVTRGDTFEDTAAASSPAVKELNGLYDNSLKAYYKEVKKVIEASDVILEILDARDPLGTRCYQLEDNVLQSGPNKRLVLVLNKCDLIPKDNLLQWLSHLRREFPTIAFKASTQNQRMNLSHCKVPIHLAKSDLIKSSKCFGASVLMKILGNYCRNKGISSAIRVGIVGLPNVGKSSVINSLKRKQSCNVGATPGVTRSMQEVHLDKHVTLIDSPGVLFTKEDDPMAALRNAVRVDAIPDPVQPVDIILKKCSKVQLMLFYKVADFSGSQEFLAFVGAKRGFLKKGGIPDITKAARLVLQDWTSGKISFYTTPPADRLQKIHLSAEIITTMSKEFDLEAVEAEEQMLIDEMPEADSSRATAVVHDMDDTEVSLPHSHQDNTQTVVNVNSINSASGESDDGWQSEDPQQRLEGNQQVSKRLKKVLKRRRKIKSKRDVTASAMADDIGSILKLTDPTSMEE